jgi:hypothetical protein
MSGVNSSKISVEKIGSTYMTAFGDVLRHIVLHDLNRLPEQNHSDSMKLLCADECGR